jgi:hypothetical protein
MLNSLIGSKKGKSSKGGKRRDTKQLQTAKPGYSYLVNNGPSRSPPMPKELSVALVNRQNLSVSVPVAGPTRNIFGLLEYLGKRPLYLREFYTMYKFSRVLSVDYHFELINLTAVPFEVGFAILPTSDAGTISLEQVIEKPGSVRRAVSAIGGMDRITLQKRAVAQDWMGNPYNTRDYWVTEAQSASGTPLDADEPAGVLVIQGLTGTVAYSLVTKITYHVQFFDLEVAPVSLQVEEHSQYTTEDDVPRPPTPTKLPKLSIRSQAFKK